MKTEEQLKEEIEKGAIEYCGEPLKDMDSEGECVYDGFISGALSESARAFHQHGLYTEEEVLNMLHDYENDMSYYGRDNYYSNCFPAATANWFNKHKKK